MLDWRPGLRRACQVLFCACAVAGGGLSAYATRDVPRPDVGRFPHAMPASLPALSAAAEPPSPTEPTAQEPTPNAPPPLGTFAEALARGQVITGATPHRLILFTFDDGPDPRNTPRLLDTLDRYGIHAVFFLTAHRMSGLGPWHRRNRELAREIARRGHIIANHTVDHAQLPLLDNASVRAQVEGADAVFEETFGARAWLIRPPGGARSARVDRLLAERGYTQVLWNLGTGDFQVRDSQQVLHTFRRVLARRERENGDRGGIVLLHDTHEWSVDAVPRIVSWLRQQNCGYLAEGEELYDIVDDPRLFQAERVEGDPSAEAPPAEPAPDVLARRQRRLRAETERRCARVASR